MTNFLRVLILEDQPADAELMVHELRRAGYDPDWHRVESEADFVAALAPEPELILSDYNLPDWDGVRALRLVRERGLDVPFILVSAAIGEEVAVAAMKAGANDYLLKGQPARLGVAVGRELRDRCQRQERDAELRLRARQQAAVAALGQFALTATDLDELLDRAVRLVAETLDVELCKVLELLPGDRGLLLRAGVGWKDGLIGRATVGAGMDSQAGYTLLRSAPVIVDNLPTEARFRGPSLLFDHAVVSGLSTAIPGPKQPYGVLGAHTCRPRRFTTDDTNFIQAIANILATVSQRRRLEEQFRQAQKMEAVGQLAGGVAHDFNNLLTVISGFSDMVIGSLRPDDPSRQLLAEVRKAGERAAGLTRQLLAFSRQQVLAPRVLDLNDLVEDVAKMLARLIGEDMDLVTALALNLDKVRADPGQLEQVLMNLAVNARDAMPGGGKLTVETRNVELDESFAAVHPEVPPGSYVMLAVSDTGHGMDAETRVRIFEPFFTTKGPGKGTGLGLATVYGIVQQSHGFVYVYSEPGMGTTFKVYLPAVTGPAAPKPASHPGVNLGTEMVLVVEDQDEVREFVVQVLRVSGYRVLAAGTAADGLSVCDRHDGPIHLALLDVVLPCMNGRELAERLTALRPGVKTLFMSGYTDTAVLRNGVVGPEADFIQKPFSPKSLIRKVRHVLDRKGGSCSQLGASHAHTG